MREGLIDQLIKLVVHAIEGSRNGKGKTTSLLVNMALAGRNHELRGARTSGRPCNHTLDDDRPRSRLFAAYEHSRWRELPCRRGR
jgi:hypothetical protein